ncbi:MAG: cation:proton antiporter [Acidimicrobiales bacterium]
MVDAVVVGARGTFVSLVVIAVIAVLAPLLVDLRPSLRIPAVVVEVVLGAVAGPSGFGLVHPNIATEVLSFLGLGFLLFTAGLELDPTQSRQYVGGAFADYGISIVLGIVAAFVISLVEPTSKPLLLAFALTSTSLGVIVPILRDAHVTHTDFGQLAVAHASLGEFGSLILISLVFSASSGSPGLRIALFVLLAALLGALALVMSGALRSGRLFRRVRRLRGGSWQLDIRLAILVLVTFAAVADLFGFDGILGCFAAGALLRIIDRRGFTHNPELHVKIDAVGYGFLIPVFFITSGINLNFRVLVEHPAHFLLIPAFLISLLVVRGLPAQRRRKDLGPYRAAALGLMLSSTLTVIVVVVSIASALHILDAPACSALLAAGLLSELLFPPVALWLLDRQAGVLERAAG